MTLECLICLWLMNMSASGVRRSVMGLEGALTTPSTCTSARLVVKQWFYARWYIPIEMSNFMREQDKLTTPSSCTSARGVGIKHISFSNKECLIQILSQYFRIFLGYRVLASKTYPICQLRVEKQCWRVKVAGGLKRVVCSFGNDIIGEIKM